MLRKKPTSRLPVLNGTSPYLFVSYINIAIQPPYNMISGASEVEVDTESPNCHGSEAGGDIRSYRILEESTQPMLSSGVINLLQGDEADMFTAESVQFGLLFVQQPIEAAACGEHDKRRQCIDPRPIIELLINSSSLSSNDRRKYVEFAGYILSATLYDEEGKQEMPPPVLDSDKRVKSAMLGETHASSILVERDTKEPKNYFIFPDLSVRLPGVYRLSFSLSMVGASFRSRAPFCATAMSDTFRVKDRSEVGIYRQSSQLESFLSESIGFPQFYERRRSIDEGRSKPDLMLNGNGLIATSEATEGTSGEADDEWEEEEEEYKEMVNGYLNDEVLDQAYYGNGIGEEEEADDMDDEESEQGGGGERQVKREDDVQKEEEEGEEGKYHPGTDHPMLTNGHVNGVDSSADEKLHTADAEKK